MSGGGEEQLTEEGAGAQVVVGRRKLMHWPRRDVDTQKITDAKQ